MMKIIFTFAAAFFICSYSHSQDLTGWANNHISKTALVKKGEIVIIYAGVHQFKKVEALCSEISKVGAHSYPIIFSDSIIMNEYRHRPEEYADDNIRFFYYLVNLADVWLELPGQDMDLTEFLKTNNQGKRILLQLELEDMRQAIANSPIRYYALKDD